MLAYMWVVDSIYSAPAGNLKRFHVLVNLLLDNRNGFFFCTPLIAKEGKRMKET